MVRHSASVQALAGLPGTLLESTDGTRTLRWVRDHNDPDFQIVK